MDTQMPLERQKITGLSVQAQSKDVRNDEIIQESRFKHYRFHLLSRRQRKTDSCSC